MDEPKFMSLEKQRATTEFEKTLSEAILKLCEERGVPVAVPTQILFSCRLALKLNGIEAAKRVRDLILAEGHLTHEEAAERHPGGVAVIELDAPLDPKHMH